MKKFMSGMCATALAATFAVTSILPATAAPVFVPKAATADTTDVIQVHDGVKWKKRGSWNEPSFSNERINRNIRRSNNWNNDYSWYKGHRGFHKKRPGYRYHDGLWFPAGAFIAGALIGGAIANGNNNYSGGSSHVEWCYDRYRSYRASDNTFQPYHGPRQQCYSPYS